MPIQWPSRPTKAELRQDRTAERSAVYRVGRYTVTVAFDEPAATAVTYMADGNQSGDPRATLPNLEIDDGVLRLPIADLAEVILARSTPVEIARGMMEDPDVRRELLYALAERYGRHHVDDADRRQFLLLVQAQVHDAKVDDLVNRLAEMEWFVGQRFYANDERYRINSWLADRGYVERLPPADQIEVERFKVCGTVWQQARDEWRAMVKAAFPSPIPSREATQYLRLEPVWTDDPPAVEPLIEPAPTGEQP